MECEVGIHVYIDELGTSSTISVLGMSFLRGEDNGSTFSLHLRLAQKRRGSLYRVGTPIGEIGGRFHAHLEAVVVPGLYNNTLKAWSTNTDPPTKVAKLE